MSMNMPNTWSAKRDMKIENKIIDLRSDTVTKPCQQMYLAIEKATCGDAFFENDVSTINLEKRCAELFGYEDGIFTVSGTMCNQLAIKAATNPGDEIITDFSYYVNFYESSAITSLAGVHINTTRTHDGLITIDALQSLLIDRNKSRFSIQPKMLCLENTINYHSGKIFPLSDLKKISSFAKENGLLVHLDGARIFNAIVEDDIALNSFSAIADSMMISFSKGLGAPFGSMLLGKNNFIKDVRRYNKWYGGGMHQSGLMAECALYAINNNLYRIKADNNNAKLLSALLAQGGMTSMSSKIDTNIVMLDLRELNVSASVFSNLLKDQGVLLYPWSEYIIRAVTHKDISEDNIRLASKKILSVKNKIMDDASKLRVAD
jgi:threonine aldolase